MFIHPPSLPSFPSSSPIVFSIPPSFPPSLPLLILPTLVLSPSHLPFLPLLLFFLWSFWYIYPTTITYFLPISIPSSFPCFFLLLPCSLPHPFFPPYLSPLLLSFPTFLFPFPSPTLCAPVSRVTFWYKINFQTYLFQLTKHMMLLKGYDLVQQSLLVFHLLKTDKNHVSIIVLG